MALEKIKLTKNWLETEYLVNKRTLTSIADEIGCDRGTIKYKLKKYDIPLIHKTNNISASTKKLLSDKKWLETEHIVNNKTYDDIAKNLKCSVSLVCKYIKKHGIKKENVPNKLLLNKDWLYEQYFVYDISHSEIAEKLNCAQSTVSFYMKKYGFDSVGNNWPIKQEIQNKLNSKTWLYIEHIINKRTLTDIANELQCSISTISKFLTIHSIDTKRFRQTFHEKEISEFIESLNIKTIKNNRTIINPLELDIVIPEKKVAIEFCGLYWHSNLFMDKNYHLKKLEKTEQSGYTLLTIFEDEWINKKQIVKSKIKHIIHKNTNRIFARNCYVSTIDNSTKKQFVNSFHIQGDVSSSINIGLFDKHTDNIIAVMTFRKLKNKQYHFELSRYCSSLHVTGGFSKLLSWFKKNYDWEEIITFADRRWSTGNLYIKNGFEFEYNTRPNYYYIKHQKRYSRQMFMKHKLKSLLPTFDSALTEKENMINNNFQYIHDCGNMKFSIKNHK